jgi:hypothetical protein
MFSRVNYDVDNNNPNYIRRFWEDGYILSEV